jgi:hypothetical protein
LAPRREDPARQCPPYGTAAAKARTIDERRRNQGQPNPDQSHSRKRYKVARLDGRNSNLEQSKIPMVQRIVMQFLLSSFEF